MKTNHSHYQQFYRKYCGIEKTTTFKMKLQLLNKLIFVYTELTDLVATWMDLPCYCCRTSDSRPL